MLLSEHAALKLEIKSLPVKEKDKLLLRLIAKDKVLTEHLHFKLLEDQQDLVLRQEKLTAIIDEGIGELLNSKKPNSKETLLRMRKLNGSINHHFKVTKDIASELELRLHLLNQIPVEFDESIFSALYKFSEKLNVYFVKATVSLLNKYRKVHEDLQFDLKASVNELLNKIYSNKTAAIAKELGLPDEL
ncbi:hypothetical protein ABIE26_005153 [Pedobacter africanus]|uniref:Uncharacterized protein n=1 Tax=Pedobacter africanus TaxID=151894 RepID=A0ACC6L4Z9_9SPHI|nr:hypothetical protein [Pedobacter africanus]MDR6786434.1 hypothetical protein [Pedobacter africanus]